MIIEEIKVNKQTINALRRLNTYALETRNKVDALEKTLLQSGLSSQYEQALATQRAINTVGPIEDILHEMYEAKAAS